MSETGKALQLGLWLAFFAWLASIGAHWWVYVVAAVCLLVWWANND